MATTTNYTWSTPDDTALVKDGASAIRTLGSSVDTTLFTALGGAYPGLRLIKKQTIGSGVSSVTVTSAFSATYENYKVIISGGVGSVAQQVQLRLGASATGYYGGGSLVTYGTGAVNYITNNNATSLGFFAYSSPSQNIANVEINSPFLAKNTGFHSVYADNGSGAGGAAGTFAGYHASAVSYTDFTFTVGGTLTGGTIYVYGYGAS